MAINRKEFLRLSAWSFVASLLPLQQIKALSFIADLKGPYKQDNHAIAVRNATRAKEAFFNKDYALAEELYLECISLAPADIRFYDNLQNVYGAQGKWLNSIELFKNGLIANSRKIAFYDRAARSLMRLELGYKSIAREYRERMRSDSLLEDAKRLYDQAIELDRNAEYLVIGKTKVERKIETRAENINYRTNAQEIEARTDRRRNHKRRYINLTTDSLITCLDKIESRSRNRLYFDNEIRTREKNVIKEEKRIHTLLAKRYRKAKKYDEAIKHVLKIILLDRKDTMAVKMLKDLYRKTNNYENLLTFQRERNQAYNTAYTQLGLMNALNLKYEQDDRNRALIEESINIGEDLVKNWALIDSLKIKAIIKLNKTYILGGYYENAMVIVRDGIENSPTTSEGSINALIHSYANAYFNTRQYDEAITILKIGLRESVEKSELFSLVETFASRKEENLFQKNLNLYYLLYMVYKEQRDQSNMDIIIRKLFENNPEDKFAIKHT